MRELSNEEKLLLDIYFTVKYNTYIYLFWYACNIIKEHNTLMRLPWSYTCDECLDKENLEINDNDNNQINE